MSGPVPDPPRPHGKPLPVLHQDEELVVVDKLHGVVSVPGRGDTGPTALERVWAQLGGREEDRPHVVHRLDKDTSGVMAFARTREAQSTYGKVFTRGEAGKLYQLLVTGVPDWQEEEATHPLAPVRKKPGRWTVDRRNGKPSRTRFRVLRRFRDFAWLEAEIFTGRTHQIRLHAQAMGYPLAIDPYYGRKEPFFLSQVKADYKPRKGREERPWLERLPLHACRLELPREGRDALVVEAPLPKALTRVLRDLGKYGR